MTYTVAQVVAAAQRSLPDLQVSRGYDLVNQVHREILAFIPELRRDTVSIALVVGTGEYALGAQMFQVDQVVYAPGGAGSSIVLAPILIEQLNNSEPTWRTDPSASWTAAGVHGPYYYTTGKVVSAADLPVLSIGFYPVPNFNTGTLSLWGSVLQPVDLTAGETVFDSLLSSQVYVEGVRYYAATELRPEMASAFKAAYSEAIAQNKNFVRTRLDAMRGPGKIVNARPGGYSGDPASV